MRALVFAALVAVLSHDAAQETRLLDRMLDPAVQVPAALAVGADYGLAVLQSAGSQGPQFAQFVLSATAQAILARHGAGDPRAPRVRDRLHLKIAESA